MGHVVNWFAIQGPNGKALQKFYSGVFEWKLADLPGAGDSKMVPPGPGGIAGGIGTSMNKQPSVTVYISVGDVDQYLAKVTRAGGKMVMPKMELPNDMGSIAGFTDPAGNWVGLWEPSRKTPPKKAAAKKKTAAKKKATAKKSGAKAKAGGAKKKAKAKSR